MRAGPCTACWCLALHAAVRTAVPALRPADLSRLLGAPMAPPRHPGVRRTSGRRGSTTGPLQLATPGVGPTARRRSVAQLAQRACPQLPKRLQRLGAVGKEIEPRLRIPLDHHRAALDLVIYPVRGDTQ